MSQFPQQQRLDYQGRQVFEQPKQPGVYQEQMPILPTPSFAIGYTGINFGEIGELASKAGQSIYKSIEQYRVTSTNNAIQSIALDAEDKLESMYRSGATQEEVDKEVEMTRQKLSTLLTYDPMDPKFDDYDGLTSGGTASQSLLLNSRKLVSGMKARNAKYFQDQKTSDELSGAYLATLEVTEQLAQDPNMPIERFDDAIEANKRILKTITGTNNPTSSSIMEIANPADKDTALKIYKEIVDLELAKRREMATREKAKAEALKDLQEQEADSRKRENNIFRDQLKGYSVSLEVLQERIKQLDLVPFEDRTEEHKTEMAAIVTEYMDIREKAQFEIQGFGTYRGIYYGGNVDEIGPPSPEDFNRNAQYDSVFTSEAVIRNAALETPEVRTAYDEFIKKDKETETTVGKYTIDMVKKQREEAIKAVKGQWIVTSDTIQRDIAALKSQGILEQNKKQFFERLNQLESASLDAIIGFIGLDRIIELTEPTISSGVDPMLLDWDMEARTELVKSWLSLETPPEQYALIAQLFGSNTTGFKAWEEAKAAYMDIQTKVWGSVDAARASKLSEQEKMNQAANVMFRGHTSRGNLTATDYTETVDTIIERQVPGKNIADPSQVADIVGTMAENKGGIPTPEAVVVSTLFGSMYSRADTANDLLDLVSGVLPKDDTGQVIFAPNDRWTSDVGISSFPSLNIVVQDLTKDPEHPDFGKAMVAFALMPPQWRQSVINSANRGKVKLQELDRSLRLNPGLNIAQTVRMATSGGYTDPLLVEAKNREMSVKKRLGVVAMEPGEQIDETMASDIESVLEAATEGFKKGLAKPSGVPTYETEREYLNTSSTKAAYAEVAGRIYFKYYLYKQPNITEEEALTRATTEAFAEFNSQYQYTERGLRARGTVSADDKFEVDTKGQLPERLVSPAKNYPDQNTNSAVLDQNIDRVIRALPEDSVSVTDTFNEYGIGANELTEARRNPFANLTARLLRDNRAISDQTRMNLLRLWSESGNVNLDDPVSAEQTMLADLIKAARSRLSSDGTEITNEEETTRREMLIAVAAIKEASVDTRGYDSREDFLVAVRKKAQEIRQALKETKDTPSDTSPYTFYFNADGVRNNRSLYTFGVLKNNGNGSWTVLSRASEGLSLAANPKFTERGNSSNTDILSSIPASELFGEPTEKLEQQIQELYDRGLLSGSFKYRIPVDDGKIFTLAEILTIKNIFENDTQNGRYIPVIQVEQDPTTRKISIRRRYETSPVSSWWEATKSFLLDTGDYGERIRRNTPQFTEEESAKLFEDTAINEDRGIQRSAADIPVTVSQIAVERDNNPYTLYDIGSARDFYTRVYGPDIAEKLFQEARINQQENDNLIVNGIPIIYRYPDFNSWYEAAFPIARKEVEKKLGPYQELPSWPTQEESRKLGADVAYAEYRKKSDEVEKHNEAIREATSVRINEMRVEGRAMSLPDNIATIPDYEQNMDYQANIWRSATGKDYVLDYAQAKAYKIGSEADSSIPEVYVSELVLKDKNQTLATGVHEFIHVMQHFIPTRKRPLGKNDLFKDYNSEEEKYALNALEIPAWFAGLKAEYFLETGKVLYPVSSEDAEYKDFYSWLDKKDKESDTRILLNTESYYGLFRRMLLDSKPEIQDSMQKVLRQIAVNSPRPNTGMAFI